MIKSLSVLFFLFCFSAAGVARTPEPDYTLYHLGIIDAENRIFLKGDAAGGLSAFKRVFDGYDFVYVDDCVEAFELALFYHNDALAMQFIKKALQNGFELKLLDLLTLMCPCNFDADHGKKVTIYKDFIGKNEAALQRYSDSCYHLYIARVDKGLLMALIGRHIKEQLFKNYHKELGMTQKDQLAAYADVCNDNLHFMDSLAGKKVYLGERNLGIYTHKQAHELRLPFVSTENYLGSFLRSYNCPKDTKVPIITEIDYFGIGPVYNMQFHNEKSYDVLLRYRDDAVKKGYVHPREFASLRYNAAPYRRHNDLYLELRDVVNKPADTKDADEKRKQLYLPSVALDYAKHEFAHKNNLQLFFGFFNATR
jgi:hypothetical protein